MAEEVIKIVGVADMTSLNKGLDNAKGKLDTFGKSVQNTSSGLKAAVPGTNQAAFALTNLGRVAQDAPFGFIGIQNNLNPLLESFQRLKLETGSTGGALKALALSLTGPAGLGLALSLVSSAILIFSSHTKKAKEDVEEKKAATNAAAEIEKKFAQEVGAASNSLLGQAKNLLDLKKILTSTSGEYLKLTEATKKQALAQYLFSQRSEEVKNILDATIKQQLLQAKINNPLADKEYAQGLDAVSVYLNKVKNGTAFYSKAALDAAKNTEALAKATASLSGLNQLSKGLDDVFTNIINGPVKTKAPKDLLTIAEVLAEMRKQLEFLNAKELNLKTDESNDKIRAIEKAIDDLITKVGVKTNNKIVLDLFAEIRDIKFSKSKLKFGPIEKLGINVDVEIAPKINDKGKIAQAIQDAIEKARLEAQKKLAEFNQFISQTTQAIIEGSLFNLGDAIGNALIGKGAGLNGLFDSIFSSVGSQIQQLGKFLIESGVKIAAAKKAFTKLLASPLASIAVGVALVAFGAILKSVVGKKPQGFATGTRNFSGGTAIVGERGPELIGLPRGASVTPNAQSNAILNGASSGGFVASYVLRGQDLITVINRTTQSNNRAGFN